MGEALGRFRQTSSVAGAQDAPGVTMSIGHLECRIDTDVHGRIWSKLGNLHGAWLSSRGPRRYPAVGGVFRCSGKDSRGVRRSPVGRGSLLRPGESCGRLRKIPSSRRIPAALTAALQLYDEDSSGLGSLAASRGRLTRLGEPCSALGKTRTACRAFPQAAEISRGLSRVEARSGGFPEPGEACRRR